MIVILKPDTPKDSEGVRQVLAIAGRYEGVSSRLHVVEGATRSLFEVYLIGSTVTVPTEPFFTKSLEPSTCKLRSFRRATTSSPTMNSRPPTFIVSPRSA